MQKKFFKIRISKRHATLALFCSLAAQISGGTFTVSTTNDAGSGSLRAAIIAANGSPGSTIQFKIPGAGPHVIVPLTDEPDIIAPVTIDGYTQPLSHPATGSGPANILIEIQGPNTVTAGLHLAAGSAGSIIRGLAINSCTYTPGILVDDANNSITGNYIGMDAAGVQPLPNMAGIVINTDSNVIGGSTPAERNVISGVNQSLNSLFVSTGFIGSGANIAITTGSNNIVTGNYLGTNPAGTQALTQGLGLSEVGVYILSGSNNQITANLISGNIFGGIVFGQLAVSTIAGMPDTTLIQKNLIGTDFTGTSKIPNGFGISVIGNATNTTNINNVISGNDLSGIQIGNFLTYSVFVPPMPPIQGPTTILNNIVGLDISGTMALGNGRYGIEINQATANTTIGGASSGNIISANGLHGIDISALATNTTVVGNFIGTDKSGTIAFPNGHDGISIGGALKPSSNNIIGDVSGGNIVSGNAGNGVSIIGGSSNNVIAYNIIGLNAQNERLPNLKNGIYIDGSSNNTVGN